MSTTPATAEQPLRAPRRLTDHQRRVFDRTVVVLLLVPVPVILLGSGFTEVVPTVLSVLQIVPLWWRRERPVAAWAAVVLASAAQVLVWDMPVWGQLAFPIATYSAARFGPAWSGWAALGVGVVAGVVASFDWLIDLRATPVYWGAFVPYFLTMGAIVVTAWTLGTLGRVREAYVGALIERNERIAAQAEQRVALAAGEERSRIARELHDVVAHSLSVIIVQADGARYAAAHGTRPDPGVATRTLETVAATGREALADMRRMLGLLRSGETGTAPTPTLTDLRVLVEESGAAHRLSGLDREVPAVVALTTYRVVQEALTNVRKHAGPDARPVVRVAVAADGEADGLVIEVRDHGRGAAADRGPGRGDQTGGHGLVGMRERVAALDGELRADPASGGGFVVSARIPL